MAAHRTLNKRFDKGLWKQGEVQQSLRGELWTDIQGLGHWMENGMQKIRRGFQHCGGKNEMGWGVGRQSPAQLTSSQTSTPLTTNMYD